MLHEHRDDKRFARLMWHTAYAGDQPLRHYEIWRDHQKLGQVDHRPQLTKSPFTFDDALPDRKAHVYRVVTVDAAGRKAPSDELPLPATG